MSALFRFNLLFARVRLCQNQVIYVQSEGFAHANTPLLKKKSQLAVIKLNGFIQKIHNNDLGALPQLCLKAYHNLTDFCKFC